MHRGFSENPPSEEDFFKRRVFNVSITSRLWRQFRVSLLTSVPHLWCQHRVPLLTAVPISPSLVSVQSSSTDVCPHLPVSGVSADFLYWRLSPSPRLWCQCRSSSYTDNCPHLWCQCRATLLTYVPISGVSAELLHWHLSPSVSRISEELLYWHLSIYLHWHRRHRTDCGRIGITGKNINNALHSFDPATQKTREQL